MILNRQKKNSNEILFTKEGWLPSGEREKQGDRICFKPGIDNIVPRVNE